MWAETLFYVTSSSILTATALAAAWRFRIFRMGEAAIKIDLDVTKPKPRWDVHSREGQQYGRLLLRL